jgi:hypothetical protein
MGRDRKAAEVLFPGPSIDLTNWLVVEAGNPEQPMGQLFSSEAEAWTVADALTTESSRRGHRMSAKPSRLLLTQMTALAGVGPPIHRPRTQPAPARNGAILVMSDPYRFWRRFVLTGLGQSNLAPADGLVIDRWPRKTHQQRFQRAQNVSPMRKTSTA